MMTTMTRSNENYLMAAQANLASLITACQITADEKSSNATTLVKHQELDQQRVKDKQQEIMADYKAAHPVKTFFRSLVGLEYELVDLPVKKSIGTETYERIISIQDTVIKTVQELETLPEIVSKMARDYQQIEVEIETLTLSNDDALRRLETLIIFKDKYAQLRDGIDNYTLLPIEEKEALYKKICEYHETDEIPSLDIPKVRQHMLDNVLSNINKVDRKVDEVNMELRTYKQRIVELERRAELLKQTYHRLDQDYKPCIELLNRVKGSYDTLVQLAPAAIKIVTLNEAHEDLCQALIDSDEAISNLGTAVEESRTKAKIAENTLREISSITAGVAYLAVSV